MLRIERARERALSAKLKAHAGVAPILAELAPRGPRHLSAMVRVKNEEDFLLPALQSIVDHVEQIVVVDNLSSDSTPEIAHEFRAQHQDKVRVLTYPHVIARPGSESRRLARSTRERRSPSSLARFYDWCMAACAGPYVLKWDGDMVATDELRRALAEFRDDRSRQTLWFEGANLHPDMRHLLGGDLAVAPMEPRLFPQRFARHSLRVGEYETLHTPFKHGSFALYWRRPVYLHLPLCRSRPSDNKSDDQRIARSPWDYPHGMPITDDMVRSIQRHRLVAKCPRPAI